MFARLLIMMSLLMAMAMAAENKLVPDPFKWKSSSGSGRKLQTQETGYYKLEYFVAENCQGTPVLAQAEYSAGCFSLTNEAIYYTYVDLANGNCANLKRATYADSECAGIAESLEENDIPEGQQCVNIKEGPFNSVRSICTVGGNANVETQSVVSLNYGMHAQTTQCSGTIESYFTIPVDTCIRGALEKQFVTGSTIYTCDTNKMIHRAVYSSPDCSGETVILRDIPQTACAQLPEGDWFSQRCM